MLKAKNTALLEEAFEAAGQFTFNWIREHDHVDDTLRQDFIDKLTNELWIALDQRFHVEAEHEDKSHE